MIFEFSGEKIKGKRIGYLSNKGQFFGFLEANKSEIEEIITDELEGKEIYQWDVLDIDLKISDVEDENGKHAVFISDTFSHEEVFDDNRLIRKVKGTIFCISEAELAQHYQTTGIVLS